MVGNSNLIEAKFLLDLIKTEIKNIPERYVGYHKELEDTIADIILKERENMATPRQQHIRQEVMKIIEIAGDWLDGNTA